MAADESECIVRILRVLGVCGVAVLGLFLAPPAQAQEQQPCSTQGQPSGGQYPPQCAAPRASRSQVRAGESLTVTGQCPNRNASVQFRLSPGGADLGTFPTNAEGFYNATVTIPANTAPGNFTIDFRCAGAANFERGPAIEVLAAETAREQPAPQQQQPAQQQPAQQQRPQPAGTLPRTGTDPVALAAGGAALVGLGVTAVVAARRRRNQTV